MQLVNDLWSYEHHEQREGHRLSDQHTQNVVKNRRSQDDLGGAGGENIHVRQGTRGNSNAGGDHRSSNENRLDGRVPAHFHIGKAEDKWNDDASHRDQQRLAADPDQLTSAGFKTGAEQHKNRSDLRHRPESVTGRNPSQGVGPKRYSCENRSRHRGKVEPLENFSQHFRGHKNNEEKEQQLFGSSWDSSRHGAVGLDLEAAYAKAERHATKLESRIEQLWKK